MTALSTMTICMMLPQFFSLIASAITWTQAKLPATSMNRNNQSSGAITRGSGSNPVRPPKTSLSVGRSVKVKIVASTADQTTSARNATHGMPDVK